MLPLILTLVGIVAWTYHHYLSVSHLVRRESVYPFTIIFAGVFLFLAWQLVAAWFDVPVELKTARQHSLVGAMKVTLNVPVYNEDPALLMKVLRSIADQTHRVDRVQVVDDGSSVDYTDVIAYAHSLGFEWARQDNAGKRHAQMQTFRGDMADIFITIDSDTLLHPKAVENGLKPFIDPEVTSVAGLVLALNKHHGILVRTIDLVITTWQLTSRAALSVANNVLVNSGPFALYKADVVRNAEDAYLGETFGGRPVKYSDDSLLTMFALLAGKTVQQHNAVAFTTWPEGLSHHVRQQLRWCRGMFIRSIWRYRYLPATGIALWFEVISWVQFIVTTVVFADVLVIWPTTHHDYRLIIPTLLVSPLLTYGVTLRTLIVHRTDETFWQKFGVWLLSPLIIVWGWVIFRPLRVWGIVTCLKNGWGTRQAGVEVTAS
jgi:hyaluronan synthase